MSTQYPGGTTVNRVYDELNRLATLRRSSDSTDLAGYNYVGPDRVLRRNHQNGTRLSMTYDGIQGVQNPTGDHGFMDPVRTAHTRVSDNATVADYSYLWDAHGNKTESKDLSAGGPQFDYTYDLTGRMIGWNRNQSVGGQYEWFSLDNAGNRQSTSGTLPDLGSYTQNDATPQPADAQMNQYTSSPAYNHTYDNAGNLLTSDAKNAYPYLPSGYTHAEYKYDYQNRPVAFSAKREGVQVFTDNFDDEDYNGWTVRSGSWDAYDYHALIQTAAGGGAIAHPQPKHDLEAQFRYCTPTPEDTSQTAYVDVRSTTGGDALRVSITPTALSVSQRVNGSWSAIGSPVSVSTTAWYVYTIKVQAWGSHIRVWRSLWNDAPTLLLDLTGVAQYGSANLVLTLNSASGFQFDDFTVREYFEAKGTYAYDALGRRVRAQTDSVYPKITNYLFEGWQTLQERGDSGDIQAEYIYGGGLDEPLVLRRGGQDYFYHADELGNVLAITNSAGQVVEKYTYGPYGEPNFADGAGNALYGSALENPLLFNAREYDPAMRLYNYRMRWLDPQAGRFTTRDPMGAFYDPWAAGNAFSYLGNSPWMWTDPFGLATEWWERWADRKGQACEATAERKNDLADCTAFLGNIPLDVLEAIVASVNGATGASLPVDTNGLTAVFDEAGNIAGYAFLFGGIEKAGAEVAGVGIKGAAGCIAKARNAARQAGRAIANLAAKKAASKQLPVLEISASKYPELAENIDHALKAGHPDILTYMGKNRANRAAATRGLPSFPGSSRDEYPFAATLEGGEGAWVGHIPEMQNWTQGWLISDFIKRYGIKPGDLFRVAIGR